MEETKEEQINNRPWLYKKGQSGNPNGRPVGRKSLKTYLKEKFEIMTDEEREVFFDGVDKRVLWEMAEGKAEAKTDITSKGEKIVFMPQELLDKHNLKNATDTSPVDNSQG